MTIELKFKHYSQPCCDEWQWLSNDKVVLKGSHCKNGPKDSLIEQWELLKEKGYTQIIYDYPCFLPDVKNALGL